MKLARVLASPLLLLTLLASASPEISAETLPSLQVAESGEQSLAGFVAAFHDAKGDLTFSDVTRPGNVDRFAPLDGQGGSLGFLGGATWLRFSIVNRMRRPTERWLEVNFPFTQHCTLYSVSANGEFERMESGASIALDERPVKARAILIPVRLQPMEQRWLYLRIQTRTAVVADLTLWDPGTYANTTKGVTAVKYLGLGASCVVVMLSIVAAKARREWRLLGAGIAHLLIALVIATQDGLLFSLVQPTESPWQSQLAWTLAFAGFAFQFCFARAFLALPSRHPRLDLVNRGCTLVAAIAAPLPWIVFVPMFFAPLAVVVILCMTVVTMMVAHRGEPTARWYAAVWGAFWLAAMLYLVQLAGWPQELPFFRNNLVVIGFCLSGFMLCAALYVFIERIRNEADAARGELLAHMASEKQRLDAAIAEQTRALREAKSLAEQASSNKSAFLSASSHELRTPLHTIIGYTDLLLREANGETRARLQTVANSSRQLLRVIDDVLQFSRAQALVPQVRDDEVDLRSLIAHLERSGTLLSRRGGNRFIVTVSPLLPEIVKADEQRLLQVLGNLVENAAKYTDSGTIRLDVTVDTANDDRRHRADSFPVRFSVSDDGPGIPEAEQSDIFQPFRRGSTGRSRQGAGLGLAIAQDLVAAMGGCITLQSAQGMGSTFTFTLALRAVVATKQACDPRGWIAGHAPPRRTLLLVDDNAGNLRLLDTLCRSMGFSTFVAEDVDTARQICMDHSRRLDAILVDQRMPGTDGWEFLREMREREDLRAVPMVLMSATPAEPPDDLPLDVHFDATILKPIEGDALAHTLQRLLRLEWEFKEHVATTTSPTFARPPAATLADCRLLLDQGSITGLQRRAQQIASAEPRYRAFCDAVIAACRAADLRAVAALIQPIDVEAGSDRVTG